jgi:hypothetical protein
VDPITVHFGKGRALVILAGAVVFLALSIWMLTLPSATLSFQGTLAAWICIPFSILVGAFAFSRLCSNRPALIIDEKGITDNASGMAVGFVPWDDITGAGIAKFRRQQFLGIAVRNPEQYLAKAGRLKRMLMKTNRSTLGYVINIPQVALSVSIEKLLAHINEHREHLEPRRNA